MGALICTVCLNVEGNRPFVAREMMFGLRDAFDYFECGQCGCLQTVTTPVDLTRYYPTDYYAFQGDASAGWQAPRRGRLKTYLRERATRANLGFPDWFGRLVLLVRPHWELPDWLQGQRVNVRLGSDVLDVGCGVGHILRSLQGLGFKHLRGVDPYIPSDLVYGESLRILKGRLEDVQGTFDLITFHHSFEHIPEPRNTIQEAARRLRPGGTLLLRVPLAGTYAWRHYGPNWVQLDAPRHLFVPTEHSIAVLAALAGLEVRRVVHHSTAFAFWASEQYLRDIPLRGAQSVFNDPPHGVFTKAQMDEFDRYAERINATNDGDQAGFYLTKPLLS